MKIIKMFNESALVSPLSLETTKTENWNQISFQVDNKKHLLIFSGITITNNKHIK